MENTVIGVCPICGQRLEVSALHCPKCDTEVKGHFHLCKFCYLTKEQRYFAEVFIKCRGNIREVEKELGISYPTVKSRLENLVEAMGYKDKVVRPNKDEHMEILRQLDDGEIDAETALNILKNL
ncbi:DUF2089 domain-containing protein [Mahella australiensis]|uniref:DUF2089 domain-containing protein n=1 Tax=Mahella australiensis (strain DSM 15567 / CIP 107919 / 50-1 BON) TaxID=697281 RepID=F4A3B4_MAHA5|nr:DUF2089 domain-containing protein [Mahella australiensis]AEE97369.1 Protein of unknown function DUF2089 [Mahella australiensis 50-1 BON]